MTQCNELDRRAHALTVFRVVGKDGREYTATTFPRDPWQGCERFIRTARAVGWLGEARSDSYGILDVLDENGDIVQDFGIRSADAFQRIKKLLDLRVNDAETAALPGTRVGEAPDADR